MDRGYWKTKVRAADFGKEVVGEKPARKINCFSKLPRWEEQDDREKEDQEGGRGKRGVGSYAGGKRRMFGEEERNRGR